MLWPDKPLEKCAGSLSERGIGLWNWLDHDVAKFKSIDADTTKHSQDAC